MEPDSIRNLIKRLIISTRSGKLSWEETADEDLFRLTLDAGIIHIVRIKKKTMRGDDFKLFFLNQNNTPVQQFEGEEANDQDQLRQLFEAARDSALKPSEVLQRLEQEVIRRSG
jgi:hypothetical protein